MEGFDSAGKAFSLQFLVITGAKMNRQHPAPETSPGLPSVTKDRQPHTTCWNAVTTFHAQLGTCLSQLLAPHPSSVISSSGHLWHSTVLLDHHPLFSPKTLLLHPLKNRPLQWSPGKTKTGLQSSGPLAVHSYSLWWEADQYNSYSTDPIPQPLWIQTSQTLA